MPFFLTFLLGVAAVFLLQFLLRRLSDMPPQRVKNLGLWTAGIGATIIGLRFARLRGVLALAAAGLFPWLLAQKKTNAGHNPRRTRTGTMSAAEAREVLGVSREAGREEIEEAYRRLMRLVHPDQGGSEYFARTLNAAREALLEKHTREG
jgi:hypothetical protein